MEVLEERAHSLSSETEILWSVEIARLRLHTFDWNDARYTKRTRPDGSGFRLNGRLVVLPTEYSYMYQLLSSI
jgi:hypothetical protein